MSERKRAAKTKAPQRLQIVLSPVMLEEFLLLFMDYRIKMPVTEVMLFPDGNSYYVCPRCHMTMEREFMNFCDRCGQRLDWKGYKKARIVYPGSYSSVKRYVRKKKLAMKLAAEGYLPLTHPAGNGQVDFGESIYYDGKGQEQKGYALTVSFPQSNKGYTQFFPFQNQECLLTGLQQIFEHIGGVPPRLKFDNLSTAVAQVLEETERVLTDGLRWFMLHYRFQADFCNPASGNEKGNVENKVGYSRRNAFVPIPTISPMFSL